MGQYFWPLVRKSRNWFVGAGGWWWLRWGSWTKGEWGIDWFELGWICWIGWIWQWKSKFI